MDIKFKIMIGAIVVVVLWYVLREALISLSLYVERSSFGKKKLAAKKKSKFKFNQKQFY